MTPISETPQKHSEETRDDEQRDNRLPKAQLFEILSTDRRQEVLRYLDQTDDGEATLSDLAEHIASVECDCEIRELSSNQRKRVYVGLYQCHLPKMADADVIEYDRNRGKAALTERADRLLKYLYLEEESETESQGLVDRFFG